MIRLWLKAGPRAVLVRNLAACFFGKVLRLVDYRIWDVSKTTIICVVSDVLSDKDGECVLGRSAYRKIVENFALHQAVAEGKITDTFAKIEEFYFEEIVN